MSRVLKANLIIEDSEKINIEDIIESYTAIENQSEQVTEDFDDETGFELVLEEGLDDAQTVYDSILSKANEDAEAIAQNIKITAIKDRNEMMAQAEQEAQLILEQAYEEGYQTGINEAKMQVENCISATKHQLHTMQKSIEDYKTACEKNLYNLAVDIASKVLCTKLEEDPLAMMPLVKNAIASIKNSGWISVEVSDKMQDLYTALKKEELSTDPARQITVQAKDLPMGSLVLETTENVVDASILVQLENLREILGKCKTD